MIGDITMDLTGLKVQIGLKIVDKKKMHAFPDFNVLPVVIVSGMDWSYYVDMFGMGWCYDKLYGHSDFGPDSPVGQWWGCLLVPPQFVNEAAAEFPGECTAIIEADYQDFYDNRAMIRLPENHYDEVVVASIDREVNSLQEMSDANPSDAALKDKLSAANTKRSKALDPNDESPGLRKNHQRRWVDHKVKSGIVYVAPV